MSRRQTFAEWTRESVAKVTKDQYNTFSWFVLVALALEMFALAVPLGVGLLVRDTDTLRSEFTELQVFLTWIGVLAIAGGGLVIIGVSYAGKYFVKKARRHHPNEKKCKDATRVAQVFYVIAAFFAVASLIMSAVLAALNHIWWLQDNPELKKHVFVINMVASYIFTGLTLFVAGFTIWIAYSTTTICENEKRMSRKERLKEGDTARRMGETSPLVTASSVPEGPSYPQGEDARDWDGYYAKEEECEDGSVEMAAGKFYSGAHIKQRAFRSNLTPQGHYDV
jgi:hypothetical protein